MPVTVRRTDPRIVSACEQLLERADELARAAAHTIREEEPQYVDLMSHDELTRAVHPNVVGLVQSVIASEASLLVAPRRTGHERARARVPLTIVLHAYRLVALDVWENLRELCGDDPDTNRALLSSSSTLWNAVDVYAQELAAAYRHVELEDLARDARARETALASLFSGISTSEQGLADIPRALGLPKTGCFVVVVSDPWRVESGEEATTTERALAQAGVRSAWRAEGTGEIGLVAMTRGFGIDRLMDYLRSLRVGRVGVSDPFEAILDTPAAVQQAHLARDAATPGRDSVMRFGDARAAILVASSPEQARGLAYDVLAGLLEQPRDEQELLLDTLRAWLEGNGSSAEAAELLHCHPNTVRYRMRKLTELTGRDLRVPTDVVHLYLALEAFRLWMAPTG